MKWNMVFILILCAASSLAAQKAYIYEVKGMPVIESATGVQGKAGKGSALAYDELLITGKDSSASLVLETTQIVIGQNSGLGFLFTGTGTDPHPAFVPAAGIVSFTFDGAASVPVTVIACGTKVSADHAGFTVYTAIDGSTVVNVTAGAVKMDSGKESLRVSAGEFVELKVERNAVITEDGWTVKLLPQNDEPAFDYTSWNDKKIRRFFEDPLEVLAETGSLAETHCVSYDRLAGSYARATATWRQAADEYRSALASEDEDIIADARTKRLFPAQDERLRILNEMRFHARMALIVRRFSIERLFAQFSKTNAVYAQDPVTARDYLSAYNTIILRIDETLANQM